jgi:hypothetical protein
MKKLGLMIVLGLMSSCSTNLTPRQNFEARMERDIGRVMDFKGDLKKFGVVEQDNLPTGGRRLVFKEGKCKYAMILDSKNIMIEWSYVGIPDGCWTERSWWEPF